MANNPGQDLKDQAKQAGQEIKREAQNVGQQVKDEAKDMANEARQAVEGSGVQGDMESLRSDLKSLKDDVSSLLGNLKGVALSKAEGVKGTVQSSGENITQQVKGLVDSAKSYSGPYTENLEERVREHPITSVLVAFGAGLLLARIFRS